MKDFILLLLLFYVFYFIKKKIDYFKIMRDGEKEGRKKKEKPNPAFPLLGRKEMILLYYYSLTNNMYVCMYIWMDEWYLDVI